MVGKRKRFFPSNVVFTGFIGGPERKKWSELIPSRYRSVEVLLEVDPGALKLTILRSLRFFSAP